jgi:hypothetical protein
VVFEYLILLSQGTDERSLMIRRTLSRLINLQCVMCWKEISLKIRRRFPSIEHVRDSGMMTEEEYEFYRVGDLL